MRSKGETYPKLEEYLYSKGLSAVTVRDYLKTIKALEKNPAKAKKILI